jgi:hypothetical protein
MKTRTNKRHLAALAALLLPVLAVNVAPDALAGGDARALGMGGAQTAVARGVEAAIWNPANLAFSPGGSMALAGVSADLHNNSFSLDRYNEVSGAELSTADKEDLLADIPDGGFALDAAVGAGGFGLQVGRFAVTTGVTGAGRGNLDRDFFDLVLFGNTPGETVDLSDTWGEGYAVGRASLSYGQPVMSGSLGRLAVGVRASYLYGLYEMHVDESYGAVTTTMTDISGEAFVAATTAEGGAGYGVDLGMTWQAPGGWTVGAALDNAFSSLAWNGTVERTELRVTADGINAFADDLDDAVVDSDTTYAVAGYETSLPMRLRLGGAGVSGGLGLQLAFWQVDLAVMNRGGFSGGQTRGLGFGVSTRLQF